MEKNNLKLFGLLGILATLLVGTGEFLIHYSPVGYGAELPFGFLGNVDTGKMTVGHFLLVVGLPFYYAGYYYLYLAFKPASGKIALAVLILGIISFFIGGIWVTSRAFLGHLYHIVAINDSATWIQIADTYELLIEDLVNVLRVTILIVSVLFVYVILKYETLYPKWVAVVNPITVLLVVFALFKWVPVIGDYLVPTAMNVAHLVMFTVSLIAIKNR